MIDYCSNLEVVNACPRGLRSDPKLLDEIAYWRPIAQAKIDALLSATYVTPLSGVISDNIKYATILMTVSLLLATPFTDYNSEETKEERIITLSQLKESEAKKLIKDLISGDVIDTSLTLKSSSTNSARLIKISKSSRLREITDTNNDILTSGWY